MDISIFFFFCFLFFLFRANYSKPLLTILNYWQTCMLISYLIHLTGFTLFRATSLRRAWFTGILLQETFLLGTVKNSRLETLVWCAKCIMNCMKLRSKGNYPSSGWHRRRFMHRSSPPKATCMCRFLTYNTAEYNTDLTCAINLKIPLSWVFFAAWGFLCVYSIIII